MGSFANSRAGSILPRPLDVARQLVQPDIAGAERIGGRAGQIGRGVQTDQAGATSGRRGARLASTGTAALLAGSARASRYDTAAQTRAAVRNGRAAAVQRLTRAGSLACSRAADIRAASHSRIASASVRGARAAPIGATAELASVPARRATGPEAGRAIAAVAAWPGITGRAQAKTSRNGAGESSVSRQALGPTAALIAKLAELIRLDATRRHPGITRRAAG
jgi:hypothetical protein